MMIIGCKKSDLSNEKIYSTLFNWLTSEIVPVKNQISNFLHHLDSFNLDDYIKVIKFDELKVFVPQTGIVKNDVEIAISGKKENTAIAVKKLKENGVSFKA